MLPYPDSLHLYQAVLSRSKQCVLLELKWRTVHFWTKPHPCVKIAISHLESKIPPSLKINNNRLILQPYTSLLTRMLHSFQVVGWGTSALQATGGPSVQLIQLAGPQNEGPLQIHSSFQMRGSQKSNWAGTVLLVPSSPNGEDKRRTKLGSRGQWCQETGSYPSTMIGILGLDNQKYDGAALKSTDCAVKPNISRQYDPCKIHKLNGRFKVTYSIPLVLLCGLDLHSFFMRLKHFLSNYLSGAWPCFLKKTFKLKIKDIILCIYWN